MHRGCISSTASQSQPSRSVSCVARSGREAICRAAAELGRDPLQRAVEPATERGGLPGDHPMLATWDLEEHRAVDLARHHLGCAVPVKATWPMCIELQFEGGLVIRDN